jgi:hypothetical protein
MGSRKERKTSIRKRKTKEKKRPQRRIKPK